MSKLGTTKNLKKKELNKEWCDFLWSLLVKAIAGFKSEISGDTEDLQSHHLAGKPNFLLRYIVLDNGICITKGQHHFGFHHAGRVELYRSYAKKLRGEDIYEKLELLKNRNDKISLATIEEFLIKQLVPFNEKIIYYYQAKEYKSVKVIKMYERLFKKLAED